MSAYQQELLEATNIDLILNLDKSYNDIEKLKALPIKKKQNSVVRLSDIANIEFGPVSEKNLFKAQSKDALNLKDSRNWYLRKKWCFNSRTF